MRFVVRMLTFIALWAMLGGMQSCKPAVTPTGAYKVDTFEFVHSDPPANVGEAVLYVWIDSNTTLNVSGGTVKSSLPCAVMIDYTDNSETFKAAVFTAMKITYDDETVDPSTESLDLPLRINAREYESVNSVAGGRIVKTKSRIISGRIPKIITRAEPFTLQMEGYFVGVDGSPTAFTIDQHFDVVTEDAVRSAADVLQDK